MKYKWLFITVALLGLTCVAFGADCKPVSLAALAQVKVYLAHRLTGAPGEGPSVVPGDEMPGCYHKLLVKVSDSSNAIELYLSPDERFLSSALYDLSDDPEKEVGRIAARVEQILIRDDSPRLASANPQLTLVEFADLQCPYCKRFAEWYAALPIELRDQTALVFKHLPLDQHSWARSAAIYSACAGKQSVPGFWVLSDYFFAHQGNAIADDLKDLTVSHLSKMGIAIDPTKLAACVTGGAGASVVDRDGTVARDLGVTSTPTVFLNGRRVLPLQSKEELQHLLESEMARTSLASISAKK